MTLDEELSMPVVRDGIITASDAHIESITKDLEDELLKGGDNVLGTTPYQRV
jgi:hypothetical protein